MTRRTADNSNNSQPVIGITMGDPAGIGPEVIVKALADPALRKSARFLIFGMHEQLAYAADQAEIEPFWGRYQHEKADPEAPHKVILADYDEYSVSPWLKGPSRTGGEASLRFCLDAIDAAAAGITKAVVTAPVSKTSWKLARARWPGHTELLAYRCKSKRKAMMFVAGPLKVALATIHEALFEVRHKFTIGCVFNPIDLLNTAIRQYFPVEEPRIAVAALNPHAGENGRFGDEETRIIGPAVLLAQEQGINCSGPFSSDTVFLRAARGEFDGVVAMYHDQAMIPVKLLAFDSAVNVTIGIPVVRTSPAHGTAFDIAGRNIARPHGMKAAIETAIMMAKIKSRPAAVKAHAD
jgi:4-hydroxythreonine-4-phosphate dehydrogenase